MGRRSERNEGMGSEIHKEKFEKVIVVCKGKREDGMYGK